MINKVVTRLRNIGILVDLAGNYPWIYLTHVNNNKVIETYYANHGFTAFILQQDGTYTMPNRKFLFEIIRKYR